MFDLTITRFPAQKSACKYPWRNGQSATITPKTTYTPIDKRSCSRSKKWTALCY
ncbi:IMP cyclohydrolase [Lacticaseibacillus rhamnosus]|nr:IMP cyclohydrolase [Lacticaseibacillus rhamnosus]AXI93666.1 IMP cyclohydrolase [Lacticaseibacillus rhamnosus GG]ART95136.1 IMP cyclohydrolase [Lacticaseibacillus rhamnosus]AZZ22339.1 IMP cyclohydrolase [Lacticaseibacillus rhamnosus]MSC23019.1 IMP cyclohydrolase [Lacticaseibacillus rhamnosus]